MCNIKRQSTSLHQIYQSATATSPAVVVQKFDVLAGRGARSNRHLGNKLFRSLVKHNRRLYQQLKDNTHKVMLAESIITAIQRHGGRFIKQQQHHSSSSSSWWYEVTKEEAITKTQQALREIPAGTSSRALNVERMLEKKKTMKQQQQQPNTSTKKTKALNQPQNQFPLHHHHQPWVTVSTSLKDGCDEPDAKASTAFQLVRSPISPPLGGGTSPQYEHQQCPAGDSSSNTTAALPQEQHLFNDFVNDILSDAEVESLIRDSDAVHAICSLLD
jgi:hypothetical protein